MGAWEVGAGLAIAGVVVVGFVALVRVRALARSTGRALRRPSTWLLGLPALVAVLGLAVPWDYVQATETAPPPPLRIEDLPGMQTTTTTTVAGATVTTAPLPGAALAAGPSGTAPSTAVAASATSSPPTTAVTVDGTYRVGAGSIARYGIDDNVLGSSTRVVGSTDQVTGSMTIAGQTVRAAKVVVDMRSVRCGCVHDTKYNDLLDTQHYPTSQFVLSTPIPLGSIPADGVVVNIPVTGQFTIHGHTHTEHFALAAALRNRTVAINGTIPVKLSDYGISQPSAGPFGGIDNADIELLIAFVPSP